MSGRMYCAYLQQCEYSTDEILVEACENGNCNIDLRITLGDDQLLDVAVTHDSVRRLRDELNRLLGES